MENSYLIAVLKSLNKKELRELRKWLDSPAHNQREDVARLFDYLTTGDHLDNEKYLRKEKIYAKIFGSEPLDDAKLRQTVHFLTKAVEEYLIVQDLVEDELHSRITLAGVYRKRKLDKPMQRALKNAQEAITAHPYRDDQYFRNDYLFQLELYTSMEGKQRTTQMNLQEVSDALELTFIIEKLRQTCRMLSHQAVYKAGYDTGLLEAVLDYVEQHNKLAVPAIAIYYYIYRANLQKDNPQHFEQLKQQISNTGRYSPLRIARNLPHGAQLLYRQDERRRNRFCTRSIRVVPQGLRNGYPDRKPDRLALDFPQRNTHRPAPQRV
jgi:hypothetical protein